MNIPADATGKSIHVVLEVTDNGQPPLIPAVGFEPLARYPNLRRLGVWSTPPGSETAAQLGKLIELSLSLIGEPGFSDASLEKIGALPQLTRLSLIQVQISDEGLEHLRHLKNLHHLTINCTPCTGEGLKSIAKLAELRTLNYWNGSHGKVGDEHLPHLQKLTKLEGAAFFYPEITDKGLDHFRKMKSLKGLSLTNARGISDEAITQLRRDMPDCRIEISLARIEK